LLGQPTQGSKAGDTAFLRATTAAWSAATTPKHGEMFSDLRGTPHVVWAAAGMSAVVQEAVFHEYKHNGEILHGHYLVIGYVTPDKHGRPQIFRTSELMDSIAVMQFPVTAFLGDAHTLVVLTRGELVQANFLHVDAAGRPHRTAKQLQYVGDLGTIRVSAAEVRKDIAFSKIGAVKYNGYYSDGVLRTPFYPNLNDYNGPAALWGPDDSSNLGTIVRIGGATSRASVARQCAAVADQTSAAMPAVLKDPGQSAGTDYWCITGTTPDGSTVQATSIRYGSDGSAAPNPAHFIAVLTHPGRPPVVAAKAPLADPTKVPWTVRLPNGQGWLVVDKGAVLQYRVGSGTWQRNDHDVALMPPNATTLRVTKNGTPRIITLR